MTDPDMDDVSALRMIRDLLRDDPEGSLLTIEEEGASEQGLTTCVREMMSRGVPDGTVLGAIFRISARLNVFRWYASQRLASKSWKAFADAVIELPEQAWEDVDSECASADELLEYVLTGDVLAYLLRERRAAFTRLDHPLLLLIYTAKIRHLLQRKDHRRAWDVVKRVCRAIVPEEQLQEGTRDPQATSILCCLVSILFEYNVAHKKMKPLSQDEVLMKRIPPQQEPRVMTAIYGIETHIDGVRFVYHQEAVMALKLSRFYGQRHRTRAMEKTMTSKKKSRTSKTPPRSSVRGAVPSRKRSRAA